MKSVQILYPSEPQSVEIHHLFIDEANAMYHKGFLVGTSPNVDAEWIIKRGFTLKSDKQYPKDSRLIQSWEEYIRTLDFTLYAEHIRQSAIPFEIVETLGDKILHEVIQRNNWDKVFIKAKNVSLFAFGDDASVYPTSSVEMMLSNYNKLGETGPFVIREFIDDISVFYDEERYWVLNGNVYHPSEEIPDFVSEAAKRLFEFSGSKYFVIDAARNYIIEVNPGESSDRGGENPIDFFAEIFATEFLN